MSKSRTKVVLLKGLCIAAPVAILTAAHWFPWRRLFRRDLHPIHAYTIGTAAIVGTTTVAIGLANDDNCDGGDFVVMLWLATFSAGATTIAAHVIDAFIRLYGELADLKAQQKALGDNGDIR